MWIPRIARPGAIYDASAAAQTFPGGELIGALEKGDGSLENGEKEVPEGGKKEDFGRVPGFAKFLGGGLKNVNKWNLFEIIRNLHFGNAFYGTKCVFF